ncbi:MAG TPA: amino acid adenylation domain-containing protein [Longimicrobiaceae bacterium]|nr:amino acid adenylation domain-containing protein [Longimicrobiaceae bacterium]
MSTLLPDLLARQSRARPQAAALRIEGREISYRELDLLSDRLAATLRRAGVGPGERVVLATGNTLSGYAGIFATLKLGAIYVPVDPATPAERRRRIVADCVPRALIATAEGAAGLLTCDLPSDLRLVVAEGAAPGAGGPRVLDWEAALEASEAYRGPDGGRRDPGDLAMILYTSGSTGMPKGIMISHANALAFVEWAVETLGLASDDRVAGVAGLHFDLSVFDLFATFHAGATLVPLPAGSLLRPREVTEWMAAERISVWYSTPSTLILLLTHGDLEGGDTSALRLVLFAGEVLPTKHLRRLRGTVTAALYNLYGPTETNVCTYHRVDTVPTDDQETIPIGLPCAHSEVVLVTEDGRIAGVDEEGELWVRGPTVMRGYRGLEKLTAQAFAHIPGGDARLPPWYRTGDLAHRDGAGRLHFHGRRDHLVKVRGYRVELGEVEAALYSHPAVRELAVVAAPDADHGVRLRACIVPSEPGTFSTLEMRCHLARLLPPYMLPAEFRCMDELPKTSSGKVDRMQLARL